MPEPNGKDYKIAWKKIFHPQLPEVVYVDQLPAKFYPPNNAIAVFYPIENRIYVTLNYKHNYGVMIHEYGHWFFLALYNCLDELWEVPWWCWGLRKLFMKAADGVKEE